MLAFSLFGLTIPLLLVQSVSYSHAETEALENEAALDKVTVQGKEESLAEPDSKKLLKVPGSGNDPVRAIENMPGVTFSSANSRAPAVRGSSPEDNAYISDFMPIGYLFHSDNNSIFNDNLVQDFKLEKAAFPVEYNNATGGVVDVLSRAPFSDRNQKVIDVSLLRAGFMIENQVTDNQSFYLAARQSLFQYYIKYLLKDEDFKFVQLPEYYDYQGRYQIRFSNVNRMSLNINGARDQAGLTFNDESDAVKQDPDRKGGLRFKQLFNSQSILWEKIYESGLTRKFGFGHLEQGFFFGLGTGNRINVKINTYTAKSQFTYALDYQHELQWGFEYSKAQIAYNGKFKAPPCDEFQPNCRLVDSDILLQGAAKPVVNSYHLSFADAWLILPDWQLTPGVVVSTDDYTRQDFIEPRVQSRWNFKSNWWFTTAYGKHHILPDRFGSFTPEFGNRNLKQPRSDHYEIGLEHKISDTMFVKAEGYYKKLYDIIVSKPDKDTYYKSLPLAEYNSLPRYTNDATGKAYGVELFLNKNMSDRWYGWLSVAYSRTVRKNLLTEERFRYNYDQPVIINMVMNYQLNDKWDLGIKWRLQSGQLVTPLTGAQPTPTARNPDLHKPVYGDLNSERLPSKHSLDARVSRTYLYTGLEVDFYFEVLNLYARRNIIDYDYKGADYSKKVEVEGLPTIPAFGIKARF